MSDAARVFEGQKETRSAFMTSIECMLEAKYTTTSVLCGVDFWKLDEVVPFSFWKLGMNESICEIDVSCRHPKHHITHDQDELQCTSNNNWGVSLPRIHLILKMSMYIKKASKVLRSSLLSKSLAPTCPCRWHEAQLAW